MDNKIYMYLIILEKCIVIVILLTVLIIYLLNLYLKMSTHGLPHEYVQCGQLSF
jgi:hypothetical protein